MLFAACKKADFAQKSSLQNEERFFKLPANARPELKRIVEDLKIKNKIHPFINEFIASEGYPLWEFAQFKKRKFNVTNRGDGNEQDSLVQVPIVQEEAQYVKDILNIRIDSSILYKLIAGEEYASFGFNKDPNRTTPNANDIVGTIMAYEHLIWGQNIFEITDNRLFDNWPQGAPKPDSFYVVQKFTTTYSTITWVCGFHTGGQLQSCPPGVEHCFELIPEICSITWVSTTYEGDGDSGEWVPIPPTITPGSSSGSGTGTNPTTTNPPNNLPTICGSGRGWVRIVPDIETGIWKNPCTGIPVPIEDEPGEYNPYNADEVIIDPSITNHYPCLKKIIDTLSRFGNLNQKAQVALSTIFGVNKYVHLTVKMDSSLSANIAAQTIQISDTLTDDGNIDFYATIVINPNLISNATKEYIAATITHEAMHAYIEYRYAQYRNHVIDSNAIKSDFPIFWRKLSYATSDLQQHNLIANNWVNTIAQSLTAFANSPGLTQQMRDSVYRSLGWGGLEKTDIFKQQSGICDILAINEVAKNRTLNSPFTPNVPPGLSPCSNIYTINFSSFKMRNPCD